MNEVFADEVGDAIGAISSRLRQEFAAAEPGIGFVALATMRHLVRWGPRTVSELAANDRVTTQAISIRIAPLVESGLIARSVDPTDARRVVLDVTSAGREVVQGATQRANEALQSALDSLDAVKRQHLKRAIPALREVALALREPQPMSSGGTGGRS